jgi:hypothetical protein
LHAGQRAGGFHDIHIGAKSRVDSLRRRVAVEDPKRVLIDELAAQQHAIVAGAFVRRHVIDVESRQFCKHFTDERADLFLGDAAPAGVAITGKPTDKRTNPFQGLHHVELRR